MNSKGYAPSLYATFENGMVYEYIHGKELNIHSCRDISVYPLVARMLAKMHKLRYNDGTSLVPVLWDKVGCFINLISDTYASPEQQSRWESRMIFFLAGFLLLKILLLKLTLGQQIGAGVVIFFVSDTPPSPPRV